MFFKKKLQSQAKTLSDLVTKKNNSGYVFVDINNDLGYAIESSSEWPPMQLMAYGYARRIAVAALYIQGVVDKDVYDHVMVVFKGLQRQTGHTVDFQKQAASEAVRFMSEYNPAITSFLVRKIVEIAERYEVPGGQLGDAELFERVIQTVYWEERSQRQAHSLSHNISDSEDAQIINEIAKGVRERIGSQQIALQFVLEELDAARYGDEEAVQFVENSGFSASEYEGAMQDSFDEVDGADGPQQFLTFAVHQQALDRNAMVKLRIAVVEKIIAEQGLRDNLELRVLRLMKSLRGFLETDADVMPALTENIPIPEGASAKHITVSTKNILSAKKIVETLSRLTRDDTDTIIRRTLSDGKEECQLTEKEIISKLSAISNRKSRKAYRMEIVPLNEIWIWSFDFSEAERYEAEKYVSLLFDIRNGDFVVHLVPAKDDNGTTGQSDDMDEDIPF